MSGIRFSNSFRMSSMVLVLLILSAGFFEVRSNQEKTETFKVAVDLVLLDVSVHDKNGQPVRNLEQQDFRVYEDKVEQPIARFSAEESPVTWGLVLDRSSSM